MEEKPRRPWWKKKRWAATLALWLLLPVLYPAATGPVLYAEQHGWVPADTYYVTFRPLHRGLKVLGWRQGQFNRVLWDYILWWNGLAVRHQGASRHVRLQD